MLDIANYEYVDFGLPNVMWAKNRHKPPTVPVKLYGQLEPLIMTMAKKRPSWRFIGKPKWSFDNTMEVSNFDVYANREKLGSIGKELHGRSTAFVIRGNRVPRRGYAIFTKDMKKAIAYANKFFKPLSSAEQGKEVVASVSSHIHADASSATSKYIKARTDILPCVEAFIMQNTDKLKDFMLQTGVPQSMFDKYLQNKHEIDVVEEIKTGKGVYVLAEDGHYTLSEDDVTLSCITTTDATLPSNIKASLGMLKLLEDRNFLQGVGYRLNKNKFFILYPE